jgi:hypothetical protein
MDGTVTVTLGSGATSWEYSIDNGTTWVSGIGTIFVLVHETYIMNAIRVRNTDAAGNVSGTTTNAFEIIIDTVAPIIDTISPSWGTQINATTDDTDGTITVTTTGVENNQTVSIVLSNEYGVDGGSPYTGTVVGDVTAGSCVIDITAIQLQALTTGTTYTMAVTVSDVVGNSVTNNNGTFNVDTEHPEIDGITTSWGSFLTTAYAGSDGTVTVTTTGVADGNPVSISLNDVLYSGTVGTGVCAINIPTEDLLSLDQGTNTMGVTVTDTAGNSVTSNASFYVDTVHPSISISSITTSWGSFLNTANAASGGFVTVTPTVPEDEHTVTILLNTNTWTGVESTNGSYTVTIPAIGGLLDLLHNVSYLMEVTVTDVVGNTSDMVEVVVEVDTEHPTTGQIELSWGSDLNIVEAGYDGTVTITPTGVDDGQTVNISLNSVSYTGIVGTVDTGKCYINIPTGDLQSLNQGTNIMSVTVTDAVDNSATTNVTVYVDSTPPEVDDVILSWGSVLNASNNILPGTVTVETDGVEAG